MNTKPIVIVEDDVEDCDLLIEILKDLAVPNELKCFTTAIEAVNYLKKTADTPLFVISDIKMPMMDGLAFKKLLEDEAILNKNIPFVFWSTSPNDHFREPLSKLNIHKFYQKPSDIRSLKLVIEEIISSIR